MTNLAVANDGVVGWRDGVRVWSERGARPDSGKGAAEYAPCYSAAPAWLPAARLPGASLFQSSSAPQLAFFSASLSASVSGVRVSALGLIARLLSPLTDTGISPCTVLRRTMRRALP